MCEGALAWRKAQVRATPSEGRFVVCVASASGEWDELFVEEYGAEEEGTEWRWPAFTVTTVAAVSDDDDGAVEVSARFESDDDGVEAESDEQSEGGSRRPIFIRRPCGRGPNGKEWDTSIGAWVAQGASQARSWVPRRAGGPRLRGPNELLGGKRGRIQQQQYEQQLAMLQPS